MFAFYVKDIHCIIQWWTVLSSGKWEIVARGPKGLAKKTEIEKEPIADWYNGFQKFQENAGWAENDMYRHQEDMWYGAI